MKIKKYEKQKALENIQKVFFKNYKKIKTIVNNDKIFSDIEYFVVHSTEEFLNRTLKRISEGYFKDEYLEARADHTYQELQKHYKKYWKYYGWMLDEKKYVEIPNEWYKKILEKRNKKSLFNFMKKLLQFKK